MEQEFEQNKNEEEICISDLLIAPPLSAEQLFCVVCLDVFREPVVLGCCGNSLCKNCVLATNNKCPFCSGKSMIIIFT